MKPDPIGVIVYQLVVKKNPLKRQLQKRLQKLINQTHTCQIQLEGKPVEPIPIPLEVELNTTPELLLRALKKKSPL